MSKINKLGKSSFLVAILSFILVAVLAFGGTYAFFSAQSNEVKGTVTTGQIKLGAITGNALDDTETSTIKFEDVIQPNQTLDIAPFSVKVSSNIAYYTRVKLTVSIDPAGHAHKAAGAVEDGYDNDETKCNDYYQNVIDALNISTLDEVSTGVAMWHAGESQVSGETAKTTSSKYYYKLAPVGGEDLILDNPETNGEGQFEGTPETFTVRIRPNADLGNYNDTADGCEFWMDMDITISITFEVLQADYLNNGYEAGEAFEDVDAAEDAWEAALGYGDATGDAGVVGDAEAPANP